jgi:hypothetical protein
MTIPEIATSKSMFYLDSPQKEHLNSKSTHSGYFTGTWTYL